MHWPRLAKSYSRAFDEEAGVADEHRNDRLLLLVDVLVEQQVGATTVLAEPSAGLKMSGRVRPERLHGDAGALLVSFGLALRSFD